MDPSAFLPAVADMIKDSLRESDEPRDLAFWMIRAMTLAVWLFLITLGIGTPILIAVQVIGVLRGSLDVSLAVTGLYLVLIIVFYVVGSRWYSRWVARRAVE